MVWKRDQGGDAAGGSSPGGNSGGNNARPAKPRQRSADWPVSGSFLGMSAAFALVGAIMLLLPQYAKGAVFPFVVCGWLISLCLHEFGHAYAAHRFGDTTVRDKGYLTLDPFKYTDPMNSILMPMILLAMGGIGLPGGAVYIQTTLIRQRWQRAMVSAAGPLANLAVLAVLMLALIAFAPQLAAAPILKASLALLAFLQLTTILFNLLPIPGFDGWGIIEPWLPQDVREQGLRLAPIASVIVLLVFMLVPSVSSAFFNMVDSVMRPIGLEQRWSYYGLRLFRFWR
jgi:Zn-dependent protease